MQFFKKNMSYVIVEKIHEFYCRKNSYNQNIYGLFQYLDADLSPMPSPDYDAPSPEPNDQELQLR